MAIWINFSQILLGWLQLLNTICLVYDQSSWCRTFRDNNVSATVVGYLASPGSQPSWHWLCKTKGSPPGQSSVSCVLYQCWDIFDDSACKELRLLWWRWCCRSFPWLKTHEFKGMSLWLNSGSDNDFALNKQTIMPWKIITLFRDAYAVYPKIITWFCCASFLLLSLSFWWINVLLLSIFFKVSILALWHSYGSPSVRNVTLWWLRLNNTE